MKSHLHVKYLLSMYRSFLMDTWNRRTHGSYFVTDYMARFDEHLLPCGVDKDPLMTLHYF